MRANVWARPLYERWRVALVAAGYLLGLILIANLAFGTSNFFSQRVTAPVRTGGYDSQIPRVAAVDPGTIARAINNQDGGAPAISQTPSQATTQSAGTQSAPSTAKTISATTTPTYKAATTAAAQTPTWVNLLSLIPTNLTFPSRAKPTHRGR